MDNTSLPIEDALPRLLEALASVGRAVLQAPPGAGKTTRVPLALLGSGLVPGRIVMLEPRRLAARAAAERMARTLGERVGQTVGYSIRGERVIGADTRIEVVTEGILTRMMQDRPDLPGVSAVIFDEFHERSLNADLGLALVLDVVEGLRDDLMLIVMSATLDADPVAALMHAPIVTSAGRSFEVSSQWLPKPLERSTRLERAVANLTFEAMAREAGSALVFLPGEAEIRRAEALLTAALPADCAVMPLFGAMDFRAQQRAIEPVREGRKVVLATAIAETSLTIEGIRIVVDAGLARRAEFDPASGMSRLVTTRVSRAEAAQRAGRAGRTAPGTCFKLWTRGEDGALPTFAPPEIDIADLTGLALELANWGAAPDSLPFLTPPQEGRMSEARNLLTLLGAFDSMGRITPHGRALALHPLHPRLAHMLEKAGAQASDLAALLSDRDILRGAEADLQMRLDVLRGAAASADVNRAAVARVRDEARRLRRTVPEKPRLGLGVMAALAYPDRVALRRDGDAGRYVLAGGKGARLAPADPLAKARLLVATDLDGDPVEARIRQAAALSEAELREIFADAIGWRKVCEWSRREGRVLAREQEVFGALVLQDRSWRDVPPDLEAQAMLEGVRQLGLTPEPAAARFLARARLMNENDRSFPDFSQARLLATLEEWLLPFLTGITTAEAWKNFRLLPPLGARLDFTQQKTLDETVPPAFVTPLGHQIPIDYTQDQPTISLRLQEVFGVTRHPTVAGSPLRVTLLSPAQRPIQITDDLPGFWRSSYADVRKDMRGRYPKHPWPEDPTTADPTLRAKPRT